MTNRSVRLLAWASVTCALAAGPARADWATPTVTGLPLLSTCNPAQNPLVTTCAAPPLTGYVLRALRTAPIVVNAVNVGTLYERVYCKGIGVTCDASSTYIIATRLNLTGIHVTDVFHAIPTSGSTDVAYGMGGFGGTDTATAVTYLEYAGRTLKGRDQIVGTGSAADRNNGWMAFRTNTGPTVVVPPYPGVSLWSPWLLLRKSCFNGFNATPQALKIRLWDSPFTQILTSGYTLNCS